MRGDKGVTNSMRALIKWERGNMENPLPETTPDNPWRELAREEPPQGTEIEVYEIEAAYKPIRETGVFARVDKGDIGLHQGGEWIKFYHGCRAIFWRLAKARKECKHG